MARFSLTRAAASDFESIFEFGIDRFGLEQAVKYQNNLKQRFLELAARPQVSPAVEHLGKGYRRSVHGAHAIYYRIGGPGVIIVRILGQQGVANAL